MKKLEIHAQDKTFGKLILPEAVYQAVIQAQTIVHTAQQKANEIITQAESDADTIKKEAHTTTQLNAEKIQQNMKKQFEESKAEIIVDMYKQIETFLHKFRSGVPYLVENILFRIIGEFDEQELLSRCIAMGIEEMRDATEMIVRVHQRDHQFLQTMLAPWLRDKRYKSFIQLETDNFIPPGECIIVTEIGTVELSVEKQIIAFTEALKKQFGSDIDEKRGEL